MALQLQLQIMVRTQSLPGVTPLWELNEAHGHEPMGHYKPQLLQQAAPAQ